MSRPRSPLRQPRPPIVRGRPAERERGPAAGRAATLPRMRTRLTEILQIEHPVMLAGMGGVSYSEVAAAVSNGGGFGCLGASTMSNERMEQEIAATKALTDKPFGVDLLTAAPG